jgi:hypothetical protein
VNGVVGRQKAALRAKGFFAANVIPWNELRGVNRDIKSFRALTKVTALLAHNKVRGICSCCALCQAVGFDIAQSPVRDDTR